jgi:hypothetical protein
MKNAFWSHQNLLQVCERIPTIGTQLKILSTVKATMLGAQGEKPKTSWHYIYLEYSTFSFSSAEVSISRMSTNFVEYKARLIIIPSFSIDDCFSS